jgi:hypothetical protein
MKDKVLIYELTKDSPTANLLEFIRNDPNYIGNFSFESFDLKLLEITGCNPSELVIIIDTTNEQNVINLYELKTEFSFMDNIYILDIANHVSFKINDTGSELLKSQPKVKIESIISQQDLPEAVKVSIYANITNPQY